MVYNKIHLDNRSDARSDQGRHTFKDNSNNNNLTKIEAKVEKLNGIS